eukprot:TRINITY_DN6320_c1_g2_i1.p1 TRINITY_DN6320_c1_g2~~TRINITY_DN6320_c1_g2_i1.p1  ORF type:complete len:1060 (+),score=156.28 TRINITY_DN6320_c1_g2_i1:62-3241(+)
MSSRHATARNGIGGFVDALGMLDRINLDSASSKKRNGGSGGVSCNFGGGGGASSSASPFRLPNAPTSSRTVSAKRYQQRHLISRPGSPGSHSSGTTTDDEAHASTSVSATAPRCAPLPSPPAPGGRLGSPGAAPARLAHLQPRAGSPSHWRNDPASSPMTSTRAQAHGSGRCRTAPAPRPQTMRESLRGAFTSADGRTTLGGRSRLEQADLRFTGLIKEQAIDMHRDLCAFRDRLRVLEAATHVAIRALDDLLEQQDMEAKLDPLGIGVPPTTHDVIELGRRLSADHARACDNLYDNMISKDELANFSYTLELKDLVDKSYHFVKKDVVKREETRFSRKQSVDADAKQNSRTVSRSHSQESRVFATRVAPVGAPNAIPPTAPSSSNVPPVAGSLSRLLAPSTHLPPPSQAPLSNAMQSARSTRNANGRRCSDLVGLSTPQVSDSQMHDTTRCEDNSLAECMFGQELGAEKIRAFKVLHSLSLKLESSRAFPDAFQVAVEIAQSNDSAADSLFMPSIHELFYQVQDFYNASIKDIEDLRKISAPRSDLDSLAKALDIEDGDDSSESSYMTRPSGRGASSVFADMDDVDLDELPHNPRYAAYWGLTMEQLKDFHDEIIDGLDKYCACHDMAIVQGKFWHLCHNRGCTYDHCGMATKTLSRFKLDHPDVKIIKLESNMHMVVGREVKPRTKPANVGFSLMKNPKGLRINVFITHTWGENFREFVGTLSMALDPSDVVWICSLALDQNSNVESILNVPSLNDCPFAVALKQASKQVVALDHGLSLITRAWCVFELAKASQWNVPMALWFMRLPDDTDTLFKQVNDLDLGKAGASMPEDVVKIKQVIEDEGGFEKLNVKVRSLLIDRLKFSISMQNQSGLVSAKDLEGDKEAFAEELAKTKKWMIAQERQLKFRQLELEKELTYAKKSKESRPLEELLAEKAEISMQLTMVNDHKAKIERELVNVMSEQVEEKAAENKALTTTLTKIEEEKEELVETVTKQKQEFKVKEAELQASYDAQLKKGWSASQSALMSAVKKMSVVNSLNPLTGLPQNPTAEEAATQSA